MNINKEADTNINQLINNFTNLAPFKEEIKIEKSEDIKEKEIKIEEKEIKIEEKEIKIETKPNDIFIKIIKDQKDKEIKKDIWANSIYKDLPTLQSNNVGIVGETFIQTICKNLNIESSIDGAKTKKKGGGTDGDGLINKKSVEIKTAHLGSSGGSFQHELGEVPWKANYMLFLDIAPECIYLTIFKNFTEEHYKNQKKCVPYFPTKSITWRKGKGAFKLDTSIHINNKNVNNKYCIQITSETKEKDIGDFIKKSLE
jgi:hypothetical protein